MVPRQAARFTSFSFSALFPRVFVLNSGRIRKKVTLSSMIIYWHRFRQPALLFIRLYSSLQI